MVFLATAVVVDGTIPFVLGADLRSWSTSRAKSVVVAFTFYAGMFWIVPLVLVGGRERLRQPGFVAGVALGVVGIIVSPAFRPAAALVLPAVAWLHARYGLSELGIRSRGWRGDVLAILLLGAMGALAALAVQAGGPKGAGSAFGSTAQRMFGNPASTVEYLFYFGFLGERLLPRLGPWLTMPVLALMYVTHEMVNPEYWYGHVAFGTLFVALVVMGAVWVWRRSTPVVWLGDGLTWFARAWL